MADEERRRKIEAGRALLAQYRQKEAKLDGQNPHQKKKKKKTSSSKHDVHGLTIDQSQSEEMIMNSSQGVGSAVMPESTMKRTLHSEDLLKHEQVFSVENDLRLQMEAQRICLSLVYSAHIDQVREHMENEKDKALCSLKEELIYAQEENIKELQKISQLELQNIKTQETDSKKIKQLEEQIQESENFICFLKQQLEETKENYRAEIHSLQEKLQAVSEVTVEPSFSVDSVIIKESDVQKSVHPGSCLKKNIDRAIELEHAKVTQTELMCESFKQKQQATESLKCQEELQERLCEESKAREQLAVELSKAEGIINGYADEKTFFERQIQEKTDIIDRLEQELLRAGNRLQELEAEQQQIREERELLSRQKEAMKAEADPVEQRLVDAVVDAAPGADLLNEIEKLMKEKLELQCQADKICNKLQKQVKALEIDVEEQVNWFIEVEQEKRAQLMDLRQQNQALEKQLEKIRKFLDEQAFDREHERDVFQQKIPKLEHLLKVVPQIQTVGEHQTREVEQLTNHLKEKMDKCSELLLSKEQLQRDVQERNEEIEKLEFRVRELEQALLVSTDTFQKEDQNQFGALEAKPELSLEVQLQAEQGAIDRKEKETTNLEEQLEQFKDELENKNEEVQQLHMQLEIQKKESTTRLHELEQKNKLFKEELEKLGFAINKLDAISTHNQHVLFGKFAQIIQEKEVEIDRLNEQIMKLQEQLRLTTDNKVIEEKNELIRDLECQIECLMSNQECVKKNREEEIVKLNEVIEKLQQELSNIEQKTLDASSLSEQADSLKHQLEKVIALEQQVEITNEEMAFTKNVLKETNFKMDQLTQELFSLKRECDHKEKIQSIPEKNVSMTIDDLSKEQPELEVVHTEDILQPPENKMNLKSFEESSTVSRRSLETKLLQLEISVSTKDLALIQCYKQIKDIIKQGQSETEMLQRKIINLQKILEEKEAAALVSQVELEAVQEYVKFYQDKGVISSELEKTNMQNLSQVTENKMESDMSALTTRISELEKEVIEMRTTLISEKEQVETAEKNAVEKEKKLIELQKLLEESKKKLEGKETKRSPQGDFEVLKATTELIHASGESGYFDEFRAELVATKEELATYTERAEKLQKELLVKEMNMAYLQRDLSQVKNQLKEEKKKLSHFLEKEDKSKIPANRKICSEPLLIEVCKSTASQTDRLFKVNISNQTVQIIVRNAGIQTDIQSDFSSVKVSEVISQFTEKIEQMQDLHAAEILDMESRQISETETLKREHYVALQLLTEESGTLKAVIQCLRSKEGSLIPELTYSTAYQTREIYSSDSGCDWSQGIYLTQSQGFDMASEGREEEGENSTESFPWKIKGLLRAVRTEGIPVLTLSESPRGDGEDHSVQQVSGYWLQERRAYLNTISSLKDLITRMQVQRESEDYDNSQSHESLPDWRGEFLLALQQVFIKERNLLVAMFQTELTALGTRDAVRLLNCLEQRIQEQEHQALHLWAKLGLSEEREKEQLEDLKFSFEDQKQRNIELTLLLEQQSQRLNESQQKIESPKKLYDAQLSEEKGRNLELQVLLESEKVRIQEMSSDDGGLPRSSLPSDNLLIELQKQLEEKHRHIVELSSETGKYKLDSLQTRQQMEKDRQVHKKTLQSEHEGKQKILELQSKVEDLQHQLEEKRQQVYKLDLEGKRLQTIMQEFQKQELEREEKRARRILYQNRNEPTPWSLTNDGTRNWVLQQKIEETKESDYPKLIEMNGGETDSIYKLEMIRQKLQIVASKLQHLAQKASNRLRFETADDEDLLWAQETVDGIILQVQKLTGQPGEEATLALPSTPACSLTERLLRQNTELTGYISQLTEEKNDLRNVVVKLEDQMRRSQQTGTGGDCSSRYFFYDDANIEAIIASEKEIWNREKSALEKALKRAEAEVLKLKVELRNLLQSPSSDSEHDSLKKTYSKYLKTGGFRKALIYQKKYLMLLLGGFQQCEKATLMLLAQMGGYPTFTDLELIINRQKGFTRFRSAVRVAMAISRMKILVRRWHQVTSAINVNRDGFGLNPDAEKNDPCNSGERELYGEPGQTTCRSRSDQDSCRSPLPFQNRSPGTPADLSPGSIACSHLQNYDPDRALADYITRLQALQRRLGTVQTGSSTLLHMGMRR